MYFPRILFHFFPFFSKETPLLSVADREALRGQACGSAVTGDGEGQRALSAWYRSPLMSTSASAANGGTPGVKGKCGRRLSTQGA